MKLEYSKYCVGGYICIPEVETALEKALAAYRKVTGDVPLMVIDEVAIIREEISMLANLHSRNLLDACFITSSHKVANLMTLGTN